MTRPSMVRALVPSKFAALAVLLVSVATIAVNYLPVVNAAPAPVVFPGAHWEHVDPAEAG